MAMAMMKEVPSRPMESGGMEMFITNGDVRAKK